jgi:hypothetical protein
MKSQVQSAFIRENLRLNFLPLIMTPQANMKHALTIAACVLFMSLNTTYAQQTAKYTTYVAGKAAVVDEWTATTEEGTLNTISSLGAPDASASQRAVTVAINHRPKSFVLLASYPKLDHRFLEGTGPATAADYVRPRNIPKYVVDDIATWIKKAK